MAMTLRQNIAALIKGNPLTQEEICSTLLLDAGDVLNHLTHLKRSLKGKMRITPASCKACGYTFNKRSRLSPPGRCPKCKQQRIAGPWFWLEP